MTNETSDRELVFNRTLKAPRELVWQMWTDPKHLAQWWGPNGFSLTTHTSEVEEGSTWRFTMHGPDGRDYPNKIKYLKIVKPELLVYKHVDDDDTEGIAFEVTVTLKEVSGNTELTMRMEFESAEELQRVAKAFGAIEGAEQTLTRLEKCLSEYVKQNA